MISEEDQIYMQDTNKVEIQKGQNSDFTNYVLQSLSKWDTTKQYSCKTSCSRILFWNFLSLPKGSTSMGTIVHRRIRGFKKQKNNQKSISVNHQVYTFTLQQ